MLRIYQSPQEFVATMEPLLLQHEAKYGLMLGIVLLLTRDQETYVEAPFLATVSGESGIIAAATMTPPFGVILYSEHEAYAPAMQQLADHLADEGWPVPTANGPAHLSATFADAWTRRTGTAVTSTMRQRLYALRTVQSVPQASGHLRLATQDDLKLLMEWLWAFQAEALGEMEAVRAKQDQTGILRRRIDEGMLFIWEDTIGDATVPVCFLGLSRPTPHGISIGPVYTPPQYRGRGYATSATAEISQRMLDAGKDFCVLFTDLANPTSNRIYERIGYRPVTDYALYKFAGGG